MVRRLRGIERTPGREEGDKIALNSVPTFFIKLEASEED